MPSKMLDVIIFPFPNFNVATVEVYELISNSTHALQGMQLLIHAGLKVIHDSKRGLWILFRHGSVLSALINKTHITEWYER